MTRKLLEVIESEENKEVAAAIKNPVSKNLSKNVEFKNALKKFLNKKEIEAEDIKFLSEHSNNDYFKKINITAAKRLYKKISDTNKDQDKILEKFENNERLLGFLFVYAAKNRNLNLLKILDRYNHLDFSTSFIYFFKGEDRDDFYYEKFASFFFDIVLTNNYIKKTLENINNLKESWEVIKRGFRGMGAGDYWGERGQKDRNRIINIVNDFNFSPLDPPLFRIFKKHDFDFNTQNKDGDTPAHLYLLQLTKDDALLMVQLYELIKAGAKIDIKNKAGLTFVDLWNSEKAQKTIKSIKNSRYELYWDDDREEEDLKKEAGLGNIYGAKQAVELIETHIENHLIGKSLKAGKKVRKMKI